MSFVDSLPEILKPSIVFETPNKNILIHRGSFKVKNETEEFDFTGQIEFRWFPKVTVFVNGITSPDPGLIAKLQNSKLELYIDNILFGNVGVLELSSRSLTGFIFPIAVLGDKSISVEKVLFGIPNLRDLNGTRVKGELGGMILPHQSRIELIDSEFKIIIDKRLNFGHYQKLANKLGGYQLLYFGELTSTKNKPIDFNIAEQILNELSLFITFINSKRTSVLFRNGQFEDTIIWQNFTSYENAMFLSQACWVVKQNITGFNSMWVRFREIYSSVDGKNFLNHIINWYIESMNIGANLIGGIITAQTALELLFNWLVVEDKKMIIGKDAENIKASNKLRLLLSIIKLNADVPSKFTDLMEYVDANPEINDALEAIVAIRNAAVHSQKDKRNKLANINQQTWYQALVLSHKYIELSLLYILKYNEDFLDRTYNSDEYVECVQPVPWK